jgi:YD repeat-containing protein
MSDGTYSYQYDAEGNLIQRATLGSNEVLTFGYDHRNRLTEIAETWTGTNLGTTFDLKYGYDVFDRRVSRTLATTTATAVTNPDGGEAGERLNQYDDHHRHHIDDDIQREVRLRRRPCGL